MNNLIIILLLSFLSGQVLAADAIKMSALQQKNLGIKTSVMQLSSNSTGQALTQAYPAEVLVPVDQVRVVSTGHAGLINQLNVTTGQTVKRGQVLAQISSPELVTMQREFLQSQSQIRLAKQSLDRDAALFKDGIIAEKRLQASQSAYRETLALQNEQRQLLKMSGVSDIAMQNLQNKNRFQQGVALTAPISGVVLEVAIALGQRVEASMPLIKIAQLNPLWLEVHVPLADIKKSNIQKGALVHIKGIDASGKVIAMLPSMRAQDQTAIVRAVIYQGVDNLFPSQMVDAMIAPASDTITNQANFNLPTATLVNHQARHIVFVQTANGFNAREVKLVSTQGNTSIVTGAFVGTEKIAISGTAAIKASWLGMGGE
jgi:membrane fusion protein, heavy metal efflux system